MPDQPLAVDLYCGLGGWALGFLAEGYRVVGFDTERHDYGDGCYPGELTKEPGYFRCGVGDGMHRDVPLQFIDEGTASLLDPRCVGSRHAMDELREGHRRDSDINFAKGLRD